MRTALWRIRLSGAKSGLSRRRRYFETALVKEAYRLLMEKGHSAVTDDAMVVEQMLHFPIRLFYGSYENIKITTPEDLGTAEGFLKNRY